MSILSPGRNIVLIGLMGSGKTSVGLLVATALGRPFVDTDAIVAREAGRSVRALFETEGEPAFRRREAEAVRHVSALRGQVVAVGGGAVVEAENVTALRATGDLVWLDAEPQALAARLQEDRSRPLLSDAAGDADAIAQRLGVLHERRVGAYRSAAAHRIDTAGRGVAEVADDVVAWARQRPGLLSREERRT